MRSRNDLRRSEYETRERCVEQVTALQHEFLQVCLFFCVQCGVVCSM